MNKLGEGLYQVKIPFEDLYTSVFIAVSSNGTVIIDAATYPEDADAYILPALRELGVEKPDYLLLSHSHSDHTGSTNRLCELFPELQVRAIETLPFPNFANMTDEAVFAGRIKIVHLPGHTAFSSAFLDMESGLLLTCDCLQLKGIGKYVHGIERIADYIRSVERVRTMDISGIIAAHDYVPLGSIAVGDAAVQEYLDECIRALDEYEPE